MAFQQPKRKQNVQQPMGGPNIEQPMERLDI